MRCSYLVLAVAILCFLILTPYTQADPARRLANDAPPAAAIASSPVRLNEFLAGPARDWDGDGVLSTRDDEWIEIVNTGSTTVDLSSYYFTDGDSIPRFAFSGTLDPGGRRLVFGSESYAWEKATAHPAFGLSLGNTGDQVILWQVTGAESVVVDRYAYLAHEAAADRAVGRIPDGTGEWTLLDALNHYTGTLSPPATGCSPSPGWANTCSATETRRVSWGGLKQMYR